MAMRPVGVDLHRAQHRAEQLQPAHVVAVVDVARDQHRIDAGLERLAADLERARRDARVVERSGVGQDREVDVRGDLARQRHAERADQVEHHLAARRRRRVEPVDLSVAGVAGMVIDVDDEEAVEPGDAGPRQVAALHDDRGVEVARRRASAMSDVRHAGKLPSAAAAPASRVDDAIASLPSARSAYAIASCDPIESPSGRACDESTKRCRARIASTISLNLRAFVVIVVVGAGLRREAR